ncbi:dihydrodipicolinate synthase/N-acetylneuraminate lyase [Kribbella aluminosa]|uniref:Dihydrodipicolinate synthase/N-acetylneuraminate lyase n=1 Tax=Kribbella aluminosa TaxID=416017 RepID=A0ABS4V0S8_9ACTN|nr:dihydrodipicolinate synthase family protein [Kribbella aluminosa]MBP2357354.1 dihydrodipicolinate synthase/N-acetylneuraminate lyase [Kribbella aluminosa]
MWATLLLPLNADDSISFDRLESQAQALGETSVAGLYAHGTAGEFQTLTEGEYDRINHILAAAGKPFQIGASHPSAQVQLSRVERAAELAPGAIQVIAPDWLPLNPTELLDFLRRIAEAAGDVPLVLYNPPHAKTAVTTQQLCQLAEAVPSLIGLKTAGGDKAWFDEATRSGLAIFVPGHFLASMSLLGAHGSYSNVAALSPNGAVATAQDLDVERRIAEFFAAHVVPLQQAGLSNPALDKFLAAVGGSAVGGWAVGGWADAGTRVRWPMQAATDEQVAAARPVARRLLPELF